MTKERLEELIKQEAEIYVVANDNIFKYKLEKKLRPFIGCDALWVDVFNIPYYYQFNQIFETEADAEKELERQMWKEKTTAKRTERFEPPMWEDMQEGLEFIDYRFTFTINGNCNYLFTVAIWENGGSIEIEKFDVYEVEKTWLYNEPATKENYEKACEIVRDLFKGEK